MKILVVDDEVLAGSLIQEFLKQDDRISQVDFINKPEEVISMHEVNNYHLIILDLFMPNVLTTSDLVGLKLLQELKNISKNLKVLILSSHYGYKIIQQAEKFGCDGFLSKNITKSILISAIDFVLSNKKYYCPECKNVLMDRYKERNVDYTNLKDQLTEREKEVLYLLSEGYSSKEIGEKLGISESGVEFHRRSIFDKFGEKKAVKVVKIATIHNII